MFSVLNVLTAPAIFYPRSSILYFGALSDRAPGSFLAKNQQMRFHITMATGESSWTPGGLTYLLFQ